MARPAFGRGVAPRTLVAAALALALPTALFVWHIRHYGSWLVDDAMISFAYARTLSEGGGFAQQVGAVPVEGVSNASWVLLLAGLRTVGVFDRGHTFFGGDDYVVVVRTLAVVLFVGVLVCARATAYAWVRRPALSWLAAGVAGVVLALSPNFGIWSVGGLENPLYGFLAALLVATLARAQARSTLCTVRTTTVVAAIALLLAGTRPDGVVYAAAYPLVMVLDGLRREPLRAALAVGRYLVTFGLPAAALLLWRHAAFGLWVPNPTVTKNQHFTTAEALTNARLRTKDLWQAGNHWTPFVAVAALVAVALLARRRGAGPARPRVLVPVTTVLTLACAAFVILPKDWMREYRFATPAAVAGALLLGVLAVGLLDAVRTARTRVLVGALVLGLLVADATALNPRMARFTRKPTYPACFVADRMGRLTNLYADELGVSGATYLVPDLGGVLMTTRFEIVDLAGLTDPTIAQLRSAQDAPGLRDHVIEDLKPTFVRMLKAWNSGLTSDPRFERDYLTIVPGNDYVRRDAVSAAAVEVLAPRAKELAARTEQERLDAPRRSCGPLVPGQTYR